jgi:hypothetical protein
MRRFIIVLFLLILALPVQSATMVSGRPCPGGVTASCTTPTGDELTESFGDSSTSCWTDGSSVCNNTWTKNGTLSIEDSPGSPPSNTACAKSLKFDSTSAEAKATIAVPGGAIGGDEAVTINFTVYVDSSTLAGWESSRLLRLNNSSTIFSDSASIAGVSLRRNAAGEGGITHIRAGGASDYVDIPISEDTWYDVTISIPATDSGDESTISVNGGDPETFTKDTDTSGYIHVGADTVGIVGYIGNIRVTTP